MNVVHPITPFYDSNSRILILGSFPSIKSRESGFFYGHPQNRFWKVLAAVFKENCSPISIEEKKNFLRRHGIALWDTIHSCTIKGSSDSSIKDVTANDIRCILDAADIRQIFTNGKTAFTLYNRYCKKTSGRDAVSLPSTSPANATWTLDKLITAWNVTGNFE